MGPAGGDSGPTQFARTCELYTGNLGGWDGALAKCNAVLPGSHMCSVQELMRNWQRLGSQAPNPNVPAQNCASTWHNTPSWIVDLSEATASTYVHGANCHAWQIAEAYDEGPAHTYGNYYFKAIDTGYQPCNVARPILCCK